MDYSNLNSLSSNVPTLPPPDQLGGAVSTPGQPGAPAGTPSSTGDKGVGGATSGVDASKGALAATGVNSLVVDPKVQSAMSTSGLSGMGMDANSILGAAPASMSPEEMYASLGNVAGDLENVSNITNAFASDVSGLAGSGSAEGKIKGDDKAGEAKKGEKGEGKAEGKGKGGEGSSSPTAGSSVSRAESPTGETITTVTSETVSSSGAVITNTSTTMSGGAKPSAEGSGGGTTGSTETTPPPSSGCDLTTIMAEMGTLTNQESQTMAQQQTSMIDAIGMQAKDTLSQAANMIQGANMMMTMATVGLCVSMATTAYSIGSAGSASKTADDAETEAMSQQEVSLNKASESSLDETEKATNPASITKQSTADAQKSINEMNQSARTMSKEQAASMKSQTAASQKSLNNAQYMEGGTKSKTEYKGSAEHTQANADAAAAGKGPINTPEEATAFYNTQARSLHTTRTGDGTTSIAQLSKQGITPGSKISDEQAKDIVIKNRTPEAAQQIKDARAASSDPAAFDKAQDQKDTEAAATLKTNVANLKINQHSPTWGQTYTKETQEIQVRAASGMAVSQVFNAAGQMQDQLYQAAGTKDAAAAQVQGATVQAMSTGFSQTEQVAEQLRQNMSAVAQDMSSMVSATRV